MRRPRKKAVVAIQGGGAQVAFAAGAWKVLASWLREEGYEIAGVGGASAGSWNAAIIAKHAQSPDFGAAALGTFWHSIAVPSFPFLPPCSDLTRSWNGLLTGLLLGNRHLFLPNVRGVHTGTLPAFYDTGPMSTSFAELIGECPHRANTPVLVVKAVDARTGLPEVFDNGLGGPVRPEHLKASASIPLLFPATPIGDRLYWDGDFARRSVLGDVMESVGRSAEVGKDLLAIVIEPMPKQAMVPPTALGMTFTLLGGLLSGKSEDDLLLHHTRNRHGDFVRRVQELAAAQPDSALAALVEHEQTRVAAQEHPIPALMRIARAAGSYDHISRDFDYSPERIASLMEDGMTVARGVLSDMGVASCATYA